MSIHKIKVMNMVEDLLKDYPKDNKNILVFFKRFLTFSINHQHDLTKIFNRDTIMILKKYVDKDLFLKYRNRIKYSFGKVLKIISKNIGISSEKLDISYFRYLYNSDLILDGIAISFALKRMMLKNKQMGIIKTDYDETFKKQKTIKKFISSIENEMINQYYISESIVLEADIVFYISLGVILYIINLLFKGYNPKNKTYHSIWGEKIEKAGNSFVNRLINVKDDRKYFDKVFAVLELTGELIIMTLVARERILHFDKIMEWVFYLKNKVLKDEHFDDTDDIVVFNWFLSLLILVCLVTITFYLFIRILINIHELFNGTIFSTIITLGTLAYLIKKFFFAEEMNKEAKEIIKESETNNGKII